LTDRLSIDISTGEVLLKLFSRLVGAYRLEQIGRSDLKAYHVTNYVIDRFIAILLTARHETSRGILSHRSHWFAL